MNEWTSDNAFEERTSNARPWSWESKNLTTRSRHSRGVQSVKMFFFKNDQTRKVFVFKSKLRAAKDNIRPYTFLSFSVTKCWNKSSPISSISCPKVTTSVLLKKNYAFENSPTSRQTFGVLLQENWLPSTFIYRPIWSRCYRSISFHQNWPQSFKLIWANWTGRKTGRTIIQLLDKWLILIKHLGSLG